jgi:hypothetical protein
MTQAPKSQPQANQARHMSAAILLVVAAMTSAATLARYELVPWSTVIFVAGTVGGVVNNFRRLQKLPFAKGREADVFSERMVTIQIYVSPFVGGVFATVLYGIFMSGLVQGSLFPAFQSSTDPFTSFKDWAINSMPKENVDMAKAIVWSFIAGFSEGLVPNFISRITKEARGEEDAGKRPPGQE